MVSLRTKGVMVMFSVYNSLISCWDLPFILSECEIFFIVCTYFKMQIISYATPKLPHSKKKNM